MTFQNEYHCNKVWTTVKATSKVVSNTELFKMLLLQKYHGGTPFSAVHVLAVCFLGDGLQHLSLVNAGEVVESWVRASQGDRQLTVYLNCAKGIDLHRVEVMVPVSFSQIFAEGHLSVLRRSYTDIRALVPRTPST